jgi:hypothetical protein
MYLIKYTLFSPFYRIINKNSTRTLSASEKTIVMIFYTIAHLKCRLKSHRVDVKIWV